MNDVMIIDRTIKSEQCLMSLEALWINKLKPKLNTKDEYKSRTLTIKI